MTVIQAVILGLVQGLGEFLPISSSAHLIITPWIFGWKEHTLAFDVVLHLGTLVAALIYFRKDVYLMIGGFLKSLRKTKRDLSDIYQWLPWLLIVGTIPGAVIGKLLESRVEGSFRHEPLLIALTLSLGGILLWFVDRASAQQKNLNRITLADAVTIGFGQALAVIPGVSRSGGTITVARLLKIKRVDAARFSFLLSMPIIFGAGLAQVRGLPNDTNFLVLLSGFVAAGVSGFLAIKYMLMLLVKGDFRLFVWYRLLLAGLIVGLVIFRG